MFEIVLSNLWPLHLWILSGALLLDGLLGEPKWLWSRLVHPVIVMGKAIEFTDQKLNKSADTPSQQKRNGILALLIFIALALITAMTLNILINWLDELSHLLASSIELVLVTIFIAQKSLYNHVRQVAVDLELKGLDEARSSVGLIVGRETEALDPSDICRAAIESLAENFSDGIVAPAFYYALFGLPGLLIYKMINTADSMIGHKNRRYFYFGWAAAKSDDLANWLPARLSSLFLLAGALPKNGWHKVKAAWMQLRREAKKHPSPNAGWPESTMALIQGIALGGPRRYKEKLVTYAYLNESGRKELLITDINQALKFMGSAAVSLWIFVVSCALIAHLS